MKPKTMIVLLVVLVACVIFVTLQSSYRGVKQINGPTNESPRQMVFSPVPAGVKELVVTAADGGKLAFVRDGNAWRIVEPIVARADATRVNDLANSLIDLRTPQEAEALDVQTAGLNKPLWTIKLTDASGKVYTLEVGQHVAMGKGDRTFVRADGGKPTVVDYDFKTRLTQPVNEFRDKSLWEFDGGHVANITIQGHDAFQLVRQGDNWRVKAPNVDAPADNERTCLLADKLRLLTVEDFVADHPKSLAGYGLDNPRLVFSFDLVEDKPAASSPATSAASSPTSQPATQPGRHYSLAIGEDTGKNVYAKLAGQDTVFLLEGTAYLMLGQRLINMRDRQIVHLDEQRVHSVDIENASGTCKLVTQNDQWRMFQPYEGKANAAAVEDLIDAVMSLKAESFEDKAETLAPYGLDKPMATLTLTGSKGEGKLLIGSKSPSGAMTFVKSGDSSQVAVVKTDQVQKMLQAPAVYWGTLILELEAVKQPMAVVLTRGATEYDAELVEGSTQWKLNKPIKAPADQAAIINIFSAMGRTVADKIVALGPKVPDEYAKAPDAITVKLKVNVVTPEALTMPSSQPTTPKETHVFTVHVVKVGNVDYAWMEGRSPVAVGQVKPDLRRFLTAELCERTFGVGVIDRMDSITLKSGSEVLVLENEGGKNWISPNDRQLPLDQAKVHGYQVLLQQVKADRFADYKSPSDKAKYGLDKPALVIDVALKTGATWRLEVSATGPDERSRYAVSNAVEGLLVLSKYRVDDLRVALRDFEK
ncbi:MAG: DUF4340 domain-containing protein [Phycisphaerae bacterium]|jgi:hypothetical protein